MKVADLEGAELDFSVGKAEGLAVVCQRSDPYTKSVVYSEDKCWAKLPRDGYGPLGWEEYSPSTDWSQSGPIIERELIHIAPTIVGPQQWGANIKFGKGHYGATVLIAAMRCFVASKFGDEVPRQGRRNISGARSRGYYRGSFLFAERMGLKP